MHLLFQSNKRSWKRRRLASAKRLSLKSSVTELQNWIQKAEELIIEESNLKEKLELYNKINSEMISKQDELKRIELMLDECAEEISPDNGLFLFLFFFFVFTRII